jgi:cellulose synthase/poly-beta-1,6-N-acetylglucosamine synthase-like glycosyltransferase
MFAGPALALAVLSLRGERARAAYVARRLSQAAGDLPPASVIVPVKGEDEGLRENLAALASLDYPDYELLVVARSAADIPPGVLPRRARVALAHGEDSRTGEKVQNLAAAVRATRPQSRIFAFADSDARVTPRWLRALAAPLGEPGVGASTGYRWFTPEPATFRSLVRGVWDAVTFGLLGPGDNRFAWGGSMAMRKETFFATRVLDYWKDAVSDDFKLSEAVHAAGLRIAFAPGALAPCFERIGPRRLFSWMRRQLTITRVHDRRLWLAGLAAHAVYCGGMAASLAACMAGSRLAAWALAAQLSPGMLKGWNRASQAKAALPEQAAWFRRHAWAHVLLVPLVTWIWLIALGASAFGNSIEWRGYRYKLK